MLSDCLTASSGVMLAVKPPCTICNTKRTFDTMQALDYGST